MTLDAKYIGRVDKAGLLQIAVDEIVDLVAGEAHGALCLSGTHTSNRRKTTMDYIFLLKKKKLE